MPNALLATTCLMVMVMSPWSIFDLGGWLSAGALWGATTAGPTVPPGRYTVTASKSGYAPRSYLNDSLTLAR